MPCDTSICPLHRVDCGFRAQLEMNGFFNFVIRGNVIGLAAGVVIGFSTLVAAFVSAFLSPLVDWATSNVGNYGNMAFHLGRRS